MRFSLTVAALVRQNGVATKPTFEISTKPIAFEVKRPSVEDREALRWATHSEFVSNAGYKTIPVSEIADRLSDDSSLKDFYCYMAGCHHLSKISEYDRQEVNYGDVGNARWASKFFARISDRNHLLRESAAMLLLQTHERKPQIRKAIDLRFVRKNLHAAEFLVSDFFSMGINPRQSYARYLHNQELHSHIDKRLDKEYLLPYQEPGETFEDYIARIAAIAKVSLDLSQYPRELRSQKYAGNPHDGRTITLREFLAPAHKRDDWYWTPSDGGYKFEYREPQF